MRDYQKSQSSDRRSRVLFWAERLLLTVGLAALTWCVVLVSDAVIAQRIARSSLEAAAVVGRPVSPTVLAPSAEVPPRDPTLSTGSAIGALSIPRVHLSAVVLHGSDAQTLRRGPGHLKNTALPGESGNVVIAGHRDSFFWPLRNIRRGDDIFLDTPDGQFHYQVTSLRVVNPHDVSVLAATSESVLTLITCYPFWVLGNAPDRFVVRAIRITDPRGALAAVPVGSPSGRSDAPLAAEPTATQSLASADVTDWDDDTLVRHAIESYRLTYNARLSRRNDVGATALTLQACDVTVAGDRADAACEFSSTSSEDLESRYRTFALHRTNGAWAIKAIVVE